MATAMAGKGLSSERFFAAAKVRGASESAEPFFYSAKLSLPN
jgi:hypothetical protein